LLADNHDVRGAGPFSKDRLRAELE
jgi:hypothetical protein